MLEEHVPGRHRPAPRVFAAATSTATSAATITATPTAAGDPTKPPCAVHWCSVVATTPICWHRLLVRPTTPTADTLLHPCVPTRRSVPAVRLAVDFADAADLGAKLDKVVKAFASGNPAMFRLLRQQGVFVGRGAAPKVAFLYTGQGSQYVNMLEALRRDEPIVADTFDEADRVMTPLLGRSLSSYIFVDGDDPAAVAQLEQQLLQTEITQPAVLATDTGISRLLAAYGMHPDMVMGHSLGEYGALVAAGSLSFGAALEAVSARGREMASLSVADNGAMAAVFGPLVDIERIVAATPGYVVVANINSNNQAVVGGATDAVLRAVEGFTAAGMQAVRIPVSHAFHTSIVAPAAVPLIDALRRLDVRPPRMPLVANVSGEFYPADATTDTMLDALGRQVASPVQFVKGLHTLYDAGARVFVEVGPKRALHGFVEDVLGHHDDVLALFTNHPKLGDAASINQALCGLWAAGVGFAASAASASADIDSVLAAPVPVAPVPVALVPVAAVPAAPVPGAPVTRVDPVAAGPDDPISRFGDLVAGVIREGLRIFRPDAAAVHATSTAPTVPASPHTRPDPAAIEPVVITGAALGLPGVARLRRRQPRTDPRRSAVHRLVASGRAAAHGRHAHHPAREARGGWRQLRDDRRPRRGDQARRATHRSTWCRSSPSTPHVTRRSTRRHDWRSAPASTPCVTRASRS
ncbi:MAG: acyltransferase domain-containing protein [Ilumatobacteraceae bacterium]